MRLARIGAHTTRRIGAHPRARVRICAIAPSGAHDAHDAHERAPLRRRKHQHQQHKIVAPSPWIGLERWRALAIDDRRRWGAPDGAREPNDAVEGDVNVMREMGERAASEASCVASAARHIVATADPRAKAAMSHGVYKALLRGELEIVREGWDGAREMPAKPARPAEPRLVPPKEVPSPKTSPLGRVAHVMHNLAHIELNAIDLAWDTIGRYASLRGALPDQFFIDFAHVADDESRHLLWCLQRLDELGVRYGDMVAHDVLWEGAEATANDPLARLAVVPCMQEARGLDAGPRLAERLVGFGDPRSAAIVRRISDEEVGHVAVGATWFRTVCAALDEKTLDEASREAVAAKTFRAYIEKLAPDALRGPFNVDDRARAGIDPLWYASDDITTSVKVEKHVWDADPEIMDALRRRLSTVVAVEEASASQTSSSNA